jgi:hypothetical protein
MADGGSSEDAGATGPRATSVPEQIDAAPPLARGCQPDAGALGACGCVTAGGLVLDGGSFCEELANNLLYRYSFTDVTSTVQDSVSGAHGRSIETLPANGKVTFAGGNSGQYVELPADLLVGLTNLTVEAWVVWQGGESWQHLFEFAADEGDGGAARGYLYLAPSTTLSDAPGLRAVFGFGFPDVIGAGVEQTLEVGTVAHVGVVFDDKRNELVLFLDGQRVASEELPYSLADAMLSTNWIARSQLSGSAFRGSVDEFRIYAAALSAEALAFSFEQGPNANFGP